MSASDRLHALIRTMTPSEKGYFKKFAYRHRASKRKSDRAYLALFDAIDRQVRYDESSLKLEFADEGLPAFATAKHYLYGLVLRTLVQYHEERRPVDRLLVLVREIYLLLDREMEDACRAKLEQAHKLVSEFSLPEYESVLYEIEMLMIRYSAAESGVPLRRISTEREQLLRRGRSPAVPGLARRIPRPGPGLGLRHAAKR